MEEQLQLDLIAETGQKSRGGLKDYNEIRKNGVQRVRGAFLLPTFKAKITFAIDSVTFNMSCVNLFPGHQHIVINIDEANQRIIVEPCNSYDQDSLKFALMKKGRNNPRKCATRAFCGMLYNMMGWNRAARYRSMAIYQELGGKQIIVFNLDECLQVFTEIVKAGDGKKTRNTIVNMPEDWRGRFGYTLEELDVKNSVDLTSTWVTIDNITGERHASRIEAKLPTPEELIHRPYGGIRQAQQEDNGGHDDE